MSKKATGSYRVIRKISWREGDKETNVLPSDKVKKDLPTEHVAEWIRVGAIEPVEEGE